MIFINIAWTYELIFRNLWWSLVLKLEVLRWVTEIKNALSCFFKCSCISVSNLSRLSPVSKFYFWDQFILTWKCTVWGCFNLSFGLNRKISQLHVLQKVLLGSEFVLQKLSEISHIFPRCGLQIKLLFYERIFTINRFC